ncbi:hypothetical protein MNBD_IGNAVI01-1355 [hydrothermal vent metagenome]|uniref:Uncharacterized protein n=1 Tax=hydrothermal vent metagenome TaxID=652676 RepID=A0A3B1CTB7_9ZZZZ
MFDQLPTILSILFLFCLTNNKVFAWVYPEHRDITVLAIEDLNKTDRAILDELWSSARIGYESRLSESIIYDSQDYIDYPSWAAISGDHSCSAENMLYNVLRTDWILDVSRIAAELKIALAKADNRYERVNSLRDSDNKFQRADPEYATRAGSNNVHFLIPLPHVGTIGSEYASICFTEGVESNALAAYAYHHLSALSKVMYLRTNKLSEEERSKLILSALADEAFAIHFIEDVFAAGHVAGTWGNASQRKGTHDYYNEHGLAVTTWNEKQVLLSGDAYMRPQDAALAAETVKMSLEQFIAVAEGSLDPEFIHLENVSFEPSDFNVCRINKVPPGFDKRTVAFLKPILVTTPIPELGEGLGSLPRFRTELGMFVGAAPSIRGLTYNSGFSVEQNTEGAVGSVEAAIRFGVGLEGVLNESGDGLVFLDIGYRQDGSSSMGFGASPLLDQGGAVTAAIPARNALTFRLRMPFWLIPGDLIVAFPLMLFSPETYTNMAVVAGNGGLVPWQSGIATPIGRFQFMLGREIGIAFYGLGSYPDVMLSPSETEGTRMIQYKSTQFEIPIVEYRPFRTFSSDQSSSLVLQLNFGFDIPHSQIVIVPEDVNIPELKTIYYLGLRMVFDWRYYY